jgi:hypothetical protein
MEDMREDEEFFALRSWNHLPALTSKHDGFLPWRAAGSARLGAGNPESPRRAPERVVSDAITAARSVTRQGVGPCRRWPMPDETAQAAHSAPAPMV